MDVTYTKKFTFTHFTKFWCKVPMNVMQGIHRDYVMQMFVNWVVHILCIVVINY